MTGFKLFIEDPINYLLATIPEAEEHLEKLEGQRIEILIHETKKTFSTLFPWLERAHNKLITKPNVILSGKSLDLLETLVTGKTAGSVVDGNES